MHCASRFAISTLCGSSTAAYIMLTFLSVENKGVAQYLIQRLMDDKETVCLMLQPGRCVRLLCYLMRVTKLNSILLQTRKMYQCSGGTRIPLTTEC